ncbi:MAG: class I SAM-dependent methyltransferase [Luminiphilus sp.]|nr:class I SAM-dependent methyltransferase [Luminiphilus sp.]
MLIVRWMVYLSLACAASGVRADADLENSHYTAGLPTRDGIGKFYMGREISHVMGHLGAGWLERPERERQERTDLLIAGLMLSEDFVVADIGAGTGYFTFPVAQRVPRGKVFSVDIQPEMLARIEQRKAPENVANVETVLGEVDDPKLPDNEIDLAFIVDAYHEFSFPREMGERLKASLKPDGQLVLVEYRAEDPRVPIKRLHKMSEVQVKQEMAAIGLDWVRTESYLPQQHVLIFQKPRVQPRGPSDQ